MFNLLSFLRGFLVFSISGLVFEAFLSRGQPIGGFLFSCMLWGIFAFARKSDHENLGKISKTALLISGSIVVLLDTFIRPELIRQQLSLASQASIPFEGTVVERQDHFALHVYVLFLTFLLLIGLILWLVSIFPAEVRDLRRQIRENLYSSAVTNRKELLSYLMASCVSVFAEYRGSGPVVSTMIGVATLLIAHLVMQRDYKLPARLLGNIGYVLISVILIMPYYASQLQTATQLRLALEASSETQSHYWLQMAGYQDLDRETLRKLVLLASMKLVLLGLLLLICIFGFFIFWFNRGLTRHGAVENEPSC